VPNTRYEGGLFYIGERQITDTFMPYNFEKVRYMTFNNVYKSLKIPKVTIAKYIESGDLYACIYCECIVYISKDSINSLLIKLGRPTMLNDEAKKHVVYARSKYMETNHTQTSYASDRKELEDQVSIVLNYAMNRDIYISKIYKDSGPSHVFTTKSRSGLTELIYDAMEYKIEAVYVMSKDRISMLMPEMFEYIMRLYGVRVVYINEFASTHMYKDEARDEMLEIVKLIRKKYDL
jgi:predicted site-specific integrase-resolvase